MAVKSPEAIERRRKYQRDYRRINHEREKPLLRAWTDLNLDHRHRYARNRRLARYGLTELQFNDILKRQGNRCAICDLLLESPTHGVRGTGVHGNCAVIDHKGDKVRGILCSRCNVGIGMLKDSPDILRKAIDYLGRES